MLGLNLGQGVCQFCVIGQVIRIPALIALGVIRFLGLVDRSARSRLF